MLQYKDKYWPSVYKNKILYMLSTRDVHEAYGNIQTYSEGLEKAFYANGDQKKVGVANSYQIR